MNVAVDAEARLRAEGLDPGRWGNAAHDRYAPHVHDYDKVVVCIEGSIAFGLVDQGRAVDLAAGDRLELPAGTRHDAVAGADGVSCLEAHLPRGSFGSLTVRPDGSW